MKTFALLIGGAVILIGTVMLAGFWSAMWGMAIGGAMGLWAVKTELDRADA